MTTIRVSRRKLLTVAIICLVLGVVGINFQSIINSFGRSDLYDIALNKDYCKTDDCEEGIKEVTDTLAKKSGVSADMVPWCMAANRINSMDLYLIDPLKNKFTDWMYTRCENTNLTLDDANISIGEPHDHDDH